MEWMRDAEHYRWIKIIGIGFVILFWLPETAGGFGW